MAIISPSLRCSYPALRTSLQDEMPRGKIRAISRLPETLGGQVLEFMGLFVEVLLGMNTFRVCMGTCIQRSMRVPRFKYNRVCGAGTTRNRYGITTWRYYLVLRTHKGETYISCNSSHSMQSKPYPADRRAQTFTALVLTEGTRVIPRIYIAIKTRPRGYRLSIPNP